jgi:hypothetical protein
MHTFEKTLFNAMLPMFERALAIAANTARAVPAPVSATATAGVATPVAAHSPAPQLPRAA